MEFSLGTEVRDEYLSRELGASARKLVEEVMLTKTRRKRCDHSRHFQRHEGG